MVIERKMRKKARMGDENEYIVIGKGIGMRGI